MAELKFYSMPEAGLLPDNHPYRYYKYSLLDPLDMPYSTFRWYYRTWGMFLFGLRTADGILTLTSLLVQLEALGVAKPLRMPADSDSDSRASEQAEKDAAKLSSKLKLNPPTPDLKAAQSGSPNSDVDISPLVIRGLSLPGIPPADLPAPQGSFGALLKRTISPIPALKANIATPSRFAQLVRRSSRSPSPPKTDVDSRPSSPVRVRRTASMSALMGALSSAMRRHGNASDGPGSSLED